MSAIFSSFSWFWLLLGVVIGWLLNRLLGKCCGSAKSAPNEQTASPPAQPPANPVNKMAAAPVSSTKPKAPVSAMLDKQAAKAAGFNIKNADDLTVIEGIGPKISELFKENGLKTFTQVATASVADMRAILDKGGARFRIANPSTWAQQAALAAENQWSALKQLQDELSGGVQK